MTLPPERPKRYELDLTTLEFSMLTQALVLMLPQVERSLNALTGEAVTTQSLVHKLLAAGMAVHARADADDARPPLTAREWTRLTPGEILQHVGTGETYTVAAPPVDGAVRLVRTITGRHPQEWRRAPRSPEDREDADG